MLSKTHRFHGLGSLNPVYRHGQTARSPQLSLRFVRNQRRRSYRVAVVVSRQVSKSAVVRNRIRRRLYEAAAAQLAAVSEPYDLVFIAYSDNLASLPYASLERQVAGLLAKAGLMPTASRRGRGIVESEGN